MRNRDLEHPNRVSMYAKIKQQAGWWNACQATLILTYKLFDTPLFSRVHPLTGGLLWTWEAPQQKWPQTQTWRTNQLQSRCLKRSRSLAGLTAYTPEISSVMAKIRPLYDMRDCWSAVTITLQWPKILADQRAKILPFLRVTSNRSAAKLLCRLTNSGYNPLQIFENYHIGCFDSSQATYRLVGTADQNKCKQHVQKLFQTSLVNNRAGCPFGDNVCSFKRKRQSVFPGKIFVSKVTGNYSETRTNFQERRF